MFLRFVVILLGGFFGSSLGLNVNISQATVDQGGSLQVTWNTDVVPRAGSFPPADVNVELVKVTGTRMNRSIVLENMGQLGHGVPFLNGSFTAVIPDDIEPGDSYAFFVWAFSDSLVRVDKKESSKFKVGKNQYHGISGQFSVKANNNSALQQGDTSVTNLPIHDLGTKDAAKSTGQSGTGKIGLTDEVILFDGDDDDDYSGTASRAPCFSITSIFICFMMAI